MRRIFIAAGAWVSMLVFFEIAYWLSSILWSEDLYNLSWLPQLLLVLEMFLFWFATIAVGAVACWYSVPEKKSDVS